MAWWSDGGIGSPEWSEFFPLLRPLSFVGWEWNEAECIFPSASAGGFRCIWVL